LDQHTQAPPGDDSLDVAVIGMAGRFPGAPDLARYWANLTGGVESIRRLTEQELVQAGVPRAQFERAD
jgi:acyl transferase domain-containing protein